MISLLIVVLPNSTMIMSFENGEAGMRICGLAISSSSMVPKILIQKVEKKKKKKIKFQ